ncbi:hypothetical protein FHR33_006924 [Nonomuraea dietziae]|uniref:Uncharacterized protein n=1 Tax=Nonomuraea dietziae TaxID=65515 RepID=A0A7W5YTM8_9ACTN|nr:hypothetical protein [Nonomuraea dietziae]
MSVRSLWTASAASASVAAPELMNGSASPDDSANLGPGPGRPSGPPPFALAQQAQRGGGQSCQVAGADRAVGADRRCETIVDRLGEHGEEGGVDPRATREELVEPDDEHRAGALLADQRSRASRVTAQQVESALLDGGVLVRADARALPVHGSCQCPGGPPGGPGPIEGADRDGDS